MIKKTNSELTAIAKKAWATRKENELKVKQTRSDRAKKAWVTRKKNEPKTGGHKKVVGRGRPKGSKNKKTIFYQNDFKLAIHSLLMKLMTDKNAPVGLIPTLPYLFGFELAAYEKLKAFDERMKFMAFEYAYHSGVRQVTNDNFRRQRRMLQNDKQLNAIVPSHVNGDINGFLQSWYQSDVFANILADYCGTLTKNRSTIEHILKYNLVKKGGVIWITLCARDKNKNNKESLAELIKKFGGNRYQYEQITEGNNITSYRTDGVKSAQMITCVIRRIK